MEHSDTNLEYGEIRVNPYTGDIQMYNGNGNGNGKWIIIKRPYESPSPEPTIDDPNIAYERAKRATQYR